MAMDTCVNIIVLSVSFEQQLSIALGSKKEFAHCTPEI